MNQRISCKVRKVLWAGCLCAAILSLTGCDFIYRLLQKEGAEEKDLLGVVMPNERNPGVSQIQKLLKLYGYKIGRVDGVLGANTRRAILDFQRDNHLEPTRFVDEATWKELNKFQKYGLVVDGEVNILAVQVAIEASGIKTGGADGKLGRRTKQAIVEFQRFAGLKPDGRIGFKTLSALSEYLLPLDGQTE